ncbi:MAG: tRNA (cmo5U34)-methyltransferase [bacterium]|nr:tRNA (cmo5U34)-methyltransferase [bacterium]
MKVMNIIRDQTRQHYTIQAHSYRIDGDKKARSLPSYQKYFSDLNGLCREFQHEIHVLDLGCGTGRYFACLENVKHLIGIDLVLSMLREARETFRSVAGLHNDQVSLINTDVHYVGRILHANCRFDLVYSIGTFAEYTSLEVSDLNAIHDLLAEGGVMYLTTVQFRSDFYGHLDRLIQRGKAFILSFLSGSQMLQFIFPSLVRFVKGKMIDYSILYLSDMALRRLLRRSKFVDYQTTVYTDSKHTHSIVVARKQAN